MDDFNSIVLEGNIVRDPESRETAKGIPICMFSIAVNKNYRTSQGERRQEVSFFDIETSRVRADGCMQSDANFGERLCHLSEPKRPERVNT